MTENSIKTAYIGLFLGIVLFGGVFRSLAGCNLANSSGSVNVTIGAFSRVCPGTGHEKSVTITTSPVLPSGESITLSLTRVSGDEGSAVFVSTGTATRTITGTGTGTGVTTIKIRGTQQSWGSGATAAPNNMKLKTTVTGGNGTVCAHRVFTICAHPTAFRQTPGTMLSGGKLRFIYDWDSESGRINDLDHVWVGEHVTYSDGGVHVGAGRPWKGNDADPTIMNSRTVMNGNHSSFVDTHIPPSGLPSAGPTDSYTATQHYGYRCLRCTPGAVDDTLGWQTNLMGPITISRSVYLDDTTWYYKAEKSGVVNPVPLP